MNSITNVPNDWSVTRLAGAIGAEIRGPDVSNPTDTDIAAIKALLLEHLVIFLPDQHPTVDAHVAFGRHFGALEGHPNLQNAYTPHPEMFELAATQGGVADEWHTDLTFREKPALMSILHLVKCPPTGGDTMWTNLYQAYEELSDPMKAICDGMTALHDATPHNRPEQTMIHPVVVKHPETGKNLLYVNEHFTRRLVELNATESEVLLKYLTQWVQNPRFTVRYRWSEGTIGIWDNRCTQHFVLNDFSGERIIQRVTISGDKPEGQAPAWKPWVREGRLSATSRHDRQLYLHMQAQAHHS